MDKGEVGPIKDMIQAVAIIVDLGEERVAPHRRRSVKIGIRWQRGKLLGGWGEREHHPGEAFGGVGTYWARSRSVPTPAYLGVPGEDDA